MELLIKLVEKWGDDKGLLDSSLQKTQFLKVIEEVGEVASALAKDNQAELIDGIGDVMVTLILLARQRGTDITTCLDFAYNEIKNRTGKMVNGTFIKDS